MADRCGGRGNILWRACECLAAAAKRLKPVGLLALAYKQKALALPDAKIQKNSQKCKKKRVFFVPFWITGRFCDQLYNLEGIFLTRNCR